MTQSEELRELFYKENRPRPITTGMSEDSVKKFQDILDLWWEGTREDMATWWLSKLSLVKQQERERAQEALEQERQFILNVLDGIDIADEQMGNKGGGTKAIRLALQSRPLQDLLKE